MNKLVWAQSLTVFLVLFFERVIFIAATVNIKYPAVFAFGDSILDTGNNNDLFSVTKSDFSPYGKDFDGGVATGRFGNGRVLSDLITAAMGVKDTLPAYLDKNLQDKDLPTGVCFASAGTGFDDTTAHLQNVLSMDTQLKHFQDYIGKLRAAVGADNASSIISNALYVISGGNNDVAITYTFTYKHFISFPKYSSDLVEAQRNFLKSLYQLGARHVWVLSTLPLGCLPIVRSILGGPLRVIVDYENGLAQQFNGMLASGVSNLKATLPDYDVKFVDVYSPMFRLILNPGVSGFIDTWSGCCGTGTLEMGPLCNVLCIPCSDRSSYFFWDSAHPSERAYQLTLALMLQNLNYDLTNYNISKALGPLNVTSLNLI
ncbi:GDSL esterase/lipase At1g73610-like [Cicer arietinum]|uniref:GDSL esterase/lipase At1g73610-like n=1 Tax=Cicer arietinum TaxID=3827 RepID=A0A1S2Z8D7_CICAR|nr:GDSL esterase/lipase At1g73610-like [Cicer arietinum]